ncbi:hypothetical protein GCM10012290_09670 [Halolactibacillus alkaliphilus]|uniref:Prepilin-type N-terminal cleavage/methylation domain-containing protein n=1 Tax=Halolactibacillus alkaliphilus TaxID=442899 RepID=A0A511WZ02_9BACI|nr:prepilin-type N-terminal cleavage/methylation domain-containing protein [Halolactibacillus alkaliphilus]GEN55988.1 hypothetical protein HAL01_04520 [Halolactibacillus alkaliphilus]GGN68229.1 hypothetical protein GCM10012290_09670 [Halolactibacillus alkaliphilus]SFO69424.1 Type IV pilin N-term methylation site GFxxxE [Halolactibacillus alkaliphilus]
MLKLINKHLNKTRNEKGFTLVELIVVIAILGILIAIAVPRFASTTDAAEKRTAEANHRTLVSVSQLYYGNTGDWPADLDALDGADLINKEDYDDSGKTLYAVAGEEDGSDVTITVTFDEETKTWTPAAGFSDWEE